MNSNRVGTVKDKNILFLQGPMGHFFRRLDHYFTSQGANTFKIGFNASDYLFSKKSNYTPYRQKPEEWEAFVCDFLKEQAIDKIFLFGDCRFYQSIAITQAIALDIEVFVFEEGYMRPDYITLERYGVNDFSHISRDPEFYKSLDLNALELHNPLPSKPNALELFYSAVSYYLIANIFHFRYPHYQHHRGFSAVRESICGTKSAIRKQLYRFSERDMLDDIKGVLSKRYYFVPLQTYTDFQILEHSGYKSIEKFIIEVLESFANHAPKDTFLVFKHHPVDRGRKNYAQFIDEQAQHFDIENRCIVIHDVHLPTCLDNAIATVTINSTVGLSSLTHGIPTITLGNAIYDMEGLTAKGIALNDFWLNHPNPNRELLLKYKKYLITSTQLNGSYYGLFPKIS